jgi:hypothetical protein
LLGEGRSGTAPACPRGEAGLRVYIGVPEKLSREEPKIFEDCRIRKPESYYITVGDVAKQIGWKGEYNK